MQIAFNFYPPLRLISSIAYGGYLVCATKKNDENCFYILFMKFISRKAKKKCWYIYKCNFYFFKNENAMYIVLIKLLKIWKGKRNL
jgi:hypothetical protein